MATLEQLLLLLLCGMTTTPNNCAANGDVGYMSWSQIQTLSSTYGWEIGSHTVDHHDSSRRYPSLTDAQLDAEMPTVKQP